MASDLRFIVAAMKVSHDLERIGDYARNGAKRSIVVAQQPQIGSLNGFQRMSVLVQENLKRAIDALVNDDAEDAARVWAGDEPIDDVYNGIFREMLTHMMEDPRNITAATHLLFIAKNLERIGDHATNIAETGPLRRARRPAAGGPAEGRRLGLCRRPSAGVIWRARATIHAGQLG
jgi:phosphate transport system protein